MLEKLTKIIRNETGDSTMKVSRDTVLLTDLGLNSLDLVNLVCVVEDEFDVEIPDRVIGSMKTIGDVMDFLAAQ